MPQTVTWKCPVHPIEECSTKTFTMITPENSVNQKTIGCRRVSERTGGVSISRFHLSGPGATEPLSRPQCATEVDCVARKGVATVCRGLVWQAFQELQGCWATFLNMQVSHLYSCKTGVNGGGAGHTHTYTQTDTHTHMYLSVTSSLEKCPNEEQARLVLHRSRSSATSFS